MAINAFRRFCSLEYCLFLSLGFGITLLTTTKLDAAEFQLAQDSDRTNTPPTLIEPPSIPSPFPETPPPIETPDQPDLELPELEFSETCEGNILIENFEFEGHTLFSLEGLQGLVDRIVGRNLETESISCMALYESAFAIAQLYTGELDLKTLFPERLYPGDLDPESDRQYLPPVIQIKVSEPNSENRRVVKFEMIEGQLSPDDIEVFSLNKDQELVTSKLDGYVRSRLALLSDRPLELNDLREAIQLLQIDPLIDFLNVEITPVPDKTGQNKLRVRYYKAKTFQPQIITDNSRSPSVGTTQQRVAIAERNMAIAGDSLAIGASRTDGSNGFDIIYTLPINVRNGTISFVYSQSASDIIEPPFDDIDNDGSIGDIESSSHSYSLTLRQPILRKIKSDRSGDPQANTTIQDLSLGLSASLQDSKTSLLDIPFPLSPGADENGVIRTSALRFFQEYTRQNSKPLEILSFRSQFSLGLGSLFDSTTNEQIAGVETIPDNHFFTWLLQGQYVRIFADDTSVRITSNFQLADRALPSAEQLAFGGTGSVRGYRQNQFFTDNGIFISIEAQFPVLRVFEKTGVIQIAPFFDFGSGWNSSDRANPENSTLATLGLGVQWRQENLLHNGDNLRIRIDWGVPLVDVNGRNRTLQERGVYFTLEYLP